MTRVKGDWIHLIDFLHFVRREIMFVTFCLLAYQALSWKGSTFKRNLSPSGSNIHVFFHFRVDPFSEGIKNNFDIVVSLESVSVLLICMGYRDTSIFCSGIGDIQEFQVWEILESQIINYNALHIWILQN